LPWGLRALLGYDRVLCAEVVGAFVEELCRSLSRRAKRLFGLPTVADAKTGAVAAVQRTDGALRLNVHAHGHQNVRQQIAEKILDSITKEQAETIFPVLSQEQQVMLANFIRLGVQAQAGSAPPTDSGGAGTSTDSAAAAAAAANGAAAKETN
jgi:hypothetical protein